MEIRVSAPRINAIVRGSRSITADTAIRLGIYFGMTPQFWINLQNNYDLARTEKEMGDEISKIPTLV